MEVDGGSDWGMNSDAVTCNVMGRATVEAAALETVGMTAGGVRAVLVVRTVAHTCARV